MLPVILYEKSALLLAYQKIIQQEYVYVPWIFSILFSLLLQLQDHLKTDTNKSEAIERSEKSIWMCRCQLF